MEAVCTLAKHHPLWHKSTQCPRVQLVACLRVLVVAEQVGKVRDGPPAASAAAIDSRDEAVGLQKIDAIKVIKPR